MAKKMEKKILISIAAFLGALVIALGVYYLVVVRPQLQEYERVSNLPISAIDLSMLPDGSYRGSYSYANFTYVVEVTVMDHQITDVKSSKTETPNMPYGLKM